MNEIEKKTDTTTNLSHKKEEVIFMKQRKQWMVIALIIVLAVLSVILFCDTNQEQRKDGTLVLERMEHHDRIYQSGRQCMYS